MGSKEPDVNLKRAFYSVASVSGCVIGGVVSLFAGKANFAISCGIGAMFSSVVGYYFLGKNLEILF